MKSSWRIVTGILMAGVACAVEPTLPSVDVSQMATTSPAWSAATNVDGHACRLLAGGGRGVVAIPAWWPEGSLRPPAGTAWRAEVEFKDTATAPVIVSVFAALPGNVELHRIGGTGDGAWHTALVPVPWDMVARVAGSARTELTITTPGGAAVAVASVRITAGNAVEDEARWSAETRAWTARVQDAKRALAKQPPAQACEIRTSGLLQGPLLFVRPWGDLIESTSAPQTGEVGAPIKMRVALNEIAPVQVGVYANASGLTQVQVSLAPSGLTNSAGKKLAADVEVLTTEYAVLSDSTVHPARLWPAFAVDIPAGHAQGFWLNIGTHAEAAGVYRGRVVARSGDLQSSLPIEVTVLPIRLPTMKEAGLTMGGCMGYMPPAHEMAFLARHNHNCMSFFTYGLGIDQMSRGPDGNVVINFTALDDMMAHAKQAGMDSFVYFLGGDPFGFPDTLHLERELYRKVYCGGTNDMMDRLDLIHKISEDPAHIPAEVKPLYKEWVRQFMAHAQTNNWPEPLLTPFDESPKWNEGEHGGVDLYFYTNRLTGAETVARPYQCDREKWLAEQKAAGNSPVWLCGGGAGPWLKMHFKETCALIHEAWPTARIYASIHHAVDGLVFLKDVDIFNTNAIHHDAKLGDKVRAADRVLWQYSGCNDKSTPEQARFDFGFFFASFNSRGSLCWAYNCGSRFDTSTGSQWIYGWTTPYGVARSPYFEGMRAAWDDRRYIEAARQLAHAKGRDAELQRILDGIAKEAAPIEMKDGVETIPYEIHGRDQHPAMDAWRDRITDFILATSKLPNQK
jgi:hypothetical protein